MGGSPLTVGLSVAKWNLDDAQIGRFQYIAAVRDLKAWDYSINVVRMAEETVQVPRSDWEEVMATIETLKDKEVLRGIQKSREEIKKGKFVTLEELERELENED